MNPPPRYLHNEKLAVDWLKANKCEGLYPTVSKQVPILPVNNRALSTYGYNPAIIQWRGKTIMAYRWHKDRNLSTGLAISELTPEWDVAYNCQLELPGQSTEDPKLFIHQTDLYMLWVESTWPQRPPKAVVKYGKLISGQPWKVDAVVKPDIGDNDGSAIVKNVVPWDAGNGLELLYRCSPKQEVYRGQELVVTDGPSWNYGPIKGGTPPVPYQDKLLRFFHSTVDTEPPPHRRRYFLGAYVMEPKPPYNVLAISREPIVYGSESDDLSNDARANCLQHKPKVVFPGGCVRQGTDFLVSVGINDCHCLILKLNESHLKL